MRLDPASRLRSLPKKPGKSRGWRKSRISLHFRKRSNEPAGSPPTRPASLLRPASFTGPVEAPTFSTEAFSNEGARRSENPRAARDFLERVRAGRDGRGCPARAPAGRKGGGPEDRALFDAGFCTPLAAVELAPALAEALAACRKVAPEWSRREPQSTDEGLWNFSSPCDRPSVPGVEGIRIHVSNFDLAP